MWGSELFSHASYLKIESKANSSLRYHRRTDEVLGGKKNKGLARSESKEDGNYFQRDSYWGSPSLTERRHNSHLYNKQSRDGAKRWKADRRIMRTRWRLKLIHWYRYTQEFYHSSLQPLRQPLRGGIGDLTAQIVPLLVVHELQRRPQVLEQMQHAEAAEERRRGWLAVEQPVGVVHRLGALGDRKSWNDRQCVNLTCRVLTDEMTNKEEFMSEATTWSVGVVDAQWL